MPCCKRSMDEKPEKVVPHPDGGWGWLVCIATFCTQFIVLGTMNNFGVIYVGLLKEFNAGKSEAAWVGSITYGMMFLLGPLATTLCQKITCRGTTMIGCSLAAIACALASLAPNMPVMVLTYGFLFGLGASLCYFPSVVILGQYFWKRLSLANGLTSSGSGVGSLAMGPVLQILIEQVGLRNTMRISAAMMACILPVSLIYRPINTGFTDPSKQEKSEPPPTNEKKSRFAFLHSFKELLTNKAYLLWCASLSVWMMGYFVPFVHLVRLATTYGVDILQATYLIGIMSVASTVGRLFFGRVADHPKINRLYLYQFSFLMIGISNTLCPLMTNYIGLSIYAAMFGFFEACYVLLAPVLTGDIVGREKMAHGVGLLFAIKSVPLTLGPPIAGAIYEAWDSYQIAFYIAGAVPTVAACMMCGIPFLMPREDDDNINQQKDCKYEVVMAEKGSYDTLNMLPNNGGIPQITVDRIRDSWHYPPSIQSSVPSLAASHLSVFNNRNSLALSINSVPGQHNHQGVRETCLVTIDKSMARRSRLLQLKNDLSASAYSIVRKRLDMPKLVAASECGSIACIPTHIASNPNLAPPSFKPQETLAASGPVWQRRGDNLLVVGKETVV